MITNNIHHEKKEKRYSGDEFNANNRLDHRLCVFSSKPKPMTILRGDHLHLPDMNEDNFHVKHYNENKIIKQIHKVNPFSLSENEVIHREPIKKHASDLQLNDTTKSLNSK
jgi:hypothetical protein